MTGDAYIVFINVGRLIASSTMASMPMVLCVNSSTCMSVLPWPMASNLKPQSRVLQVQHIRGICILLKGHHALPLWQALELTLWHFWLQDFVSHHVNIACCKCNFYVFTCNRIVGIDILPISVRVRLLHTIVLTPPSFWSKHAIRENTSMPIIPITNNLFPYKFFTLHPSCSIPAVNRCFVNSSSLPSPAGKDHGCRKTDIRTLITRTAASGPLRAL